MQPNYGKPTGQNQHPISGSIQLYHSATRPSHNGQQCSHWSTTTTVHSHGQCIHTNPHLVKRQRNSPVKTPGCLLWEIGVFYTISAFKFLQAYLQQTQTNHSQLFTTPEHDNLRIIKLLINMQKDISIMPSTTTMNDYNLI